MIQYGCYVYEIRIQTPQHCILTKKIVNVNDTFPQQWHAFYEVKDAYSFKVFVFFR